MIKVHWAGQLKVGDEIICHSCGLLLYSVVRPVEKLQAISIYDVAPIGSKAKTMQDQIGQVMACPDCNTLWNINGSVSIVEPPCAT